MEYQNVHKKIEEILSVSLTQDEVGEIIIACRQYEGEVERGEDKRMFMVSVIIPSMMRDYATTDIPKVELVSAAYEIADEIIKQGSKVSDVPKPEFSK